MPRYSCNPILFDHALSLSIADLKRLGYLKEHHSISGVVSWSRQGVRTSSVSVWVDLAFSHSLTISYSSEGVKHEQRLILDYSNMTSPKDFWKQVALLQMQAWGQPKVMEMIDEMKARDTFKSPEYYSRLRREVKEGMGGSKAEISESLIAELDYKVKALKRFYR